jgi:hypothetical protein
MKRFSLTLFIILLVHLNNSAQSTYELGFLPSLNLNFKMPKDWSLNLKTESRQSLMKDDFSYDYLLTDISLVASKKIGINTAIAMGYLVRIDDNGIKNRAIQQITFVKRYTNFSLSHRLLADQSFTKDDNTELRLRYRISSEIPLQGKSLDPKEFFIKLNNEYLNSLYENNYDLEIRGSTFIGYVISPTNKLEIGLDYRIDSFLIGMPRNRLWIGLNLFISL